MSNKFFLTLVSIVFYLCPLPSRVSGQEQAIPPALPAIAPGAAAATACGNNRCNFYFDKRQNIYIITKTCGEQACYCPIEVTTEPSENGNENNANQGAANAAATHSCTIPVYPIEKENMIQVSLRNGVEHVNLTLNIKDPAKLPGKSVRFQVKADAADPGFKWDVKVTYDPGKFEQHKCSPAPALDRVAESNLYYLGGTFESFGHFKEATGKTRSFEFNKNYKVEITLGN